MLNGSNRMPDCLERLLNQLKEEQLWYRKISIPNQFFPYLRSHKKDIYMFSAIKQIKTMKLTSPGEPYLVA